MSSASDTLAHPQRRVLIKKTSEPNARQALRREIELLARLATPALPAILAAAHTDDCDVAVIEHIDGPDLTTHLATSPDDALRVAVDLLRLLQSMHAAGLAHGDLKPEHILVGPDGIRLIDLGLASQMGSAVRGGTRGYIAPEYLRGSPTSVGGELFAFGRTMLAASGSRLEPPLLGIVEACMSSNPDDRPASAGAAAAALGASAASLESSQACFGSQHARARCQQLLAETGGQTAIVRGASGSGRSRLVDELRRTCVRNRWPVATLCPGPGDDPFPRLHALLAPGKPRAPLKLGLRLAALDMRLIVDDMHACSSATHDAWSELLHSLRRHGRGALIAVGPSESVSDRLVAAGALDTRLEPLTDAQISKVLEAHGVRADPATVSVLSNATAARTGWVVRAARMLARTPELSPSDLADVVAEWMGPATRDPEPTGLQNVMDESREALERGAPRRAVELLRRALPLHPNDPGLRLLLARAEARAGMLVEASKTLDSLGENAPIDARVQHAQVLERLGDHARARAISLAVMTDPKATEVIGARAMRIAAVSTLALGDPSDADALAARGLALNPGPAIAVQLITLRSDAALRRGDGSGALAHGMDALERARGLGDGSLVAQAHARIGAARSLIGEMAAARQAFSDALEWAQTACEPVDLPPYVMNLATADHRLGELGRAIEGYERAAQLSNRMGRAGSEAAARTNLGGLLAWIGARQDADRVLSDALRIAERANLAVYCAHIAMTRAEMAASDSPNTARDLAREASAAFRAIGNESGVYESRLIEAEATLDDDPSAAERLLTEASELERAGLGCRAAALRAKLALSRSDREAARVHAETYLQIARDEADREAQARALHMLGTIHESLGTGAHEGYFVEARQCLGSLAARLPPGLRERFLTDPRRAAISRKSPFEQRAPSHARAGLDPRAKRVLALVPRILREPDEMRVLESAVDEAVSLTMAERAFLLLRRSGGEPRVEVARNLDRETIRNSRFRFSRSVAQQVLETGEPLMTESATEDPTLQTARSVLDLGLRSILCVPIRGQEGVQAALYLDHRFQSGHFQTGDLEVIQSLADVIGMALENTRLHREAADRARELERAHDALQSESIRKDAELERLQAAIAHGERTPTDNGGIVGDSEPLRHALRVARRVAESDLPILIQGESGTGKELFARYVHDRSPRAKGPFVAVNCAAMPESLIESELFGHVRGAFTGALHDHPGLFRAASGGTLMLDEIGEMSLQAQTRLLRVLQEREVRPVGGQRSVPVDVRVIAATNRDLALEMEAGRFRTDLYYRIAGATLRLPPLRERRDDILPLAQVLMTRIAGKQRELPLARSAMAALLAHEWPGNVRELEHCLRRALTITQSEEIQAWDLGLESPRSHARSTTRKLDDNAVRDALHATAGNRVKAALLLGVSRITLHRFLAKHGAPVPARAGRPRSRR